MPMIDVCCFHCGKWYGFQGKPLDCPACPRCHKEPDRASLQSDQEKMDRFRELLRTLPRQSNCAEQRRMAGLSRGQAAKVMGIDAWTLGDIEVGLEPMTPEIRAKMVKAYGLTAKVEELSK